MTKEKDSPAIQLLRLVWDCEGHQMGHSWGRINKELTEGANA